MAVAPGAGPGTLTQLAPVPDVPSRRRARRDVRRAGLAAPPVRRPLRAPADARPPELKQRQHAADLAFLHQGITFTVYGHEGRHRAHLPLRPAPAHHHGRRMGGHRARPDAAHHGAQPVPAGHLPRRAHPGRRRRAARAGLQLQALPARDARRARAARHLRLGRRHRPGAAARRRVRGARGQPARAERRVATCWPTAR